jgi:hypothetical protein
MNVILSSIIPAKTTRNLLTKGFTIEIAYVMDSEKSKIELSNLSIGKEFSNVFLEELSRLAPKMEVEVFIDVLTSTSLIAQSSYKMTP